MRQYKKKEKAERDLEDVFKKLELLEKEENETVNAETSIGEYAR